MKARKCFAYISSKEVLGWSLIKSLGGGLQPILRALRFRPRQQPPFLCVFGAPYRILHNA